MRVQEIEFTNEDVIREFGLKPDAPQQKDWQTHVLKYAEKQRKRDEREAKQPQKKKKQQQHASPMMGFVQRHIHDLRAQVVRRHAALKDVEKYLDLAERALHKTDSETTPTTPSKIKKRKLTADDVRKIRASPLSRTKCAAQFGVSSANIYLIRKRETWKHVT